MTDNPSAGSLTLMIVEDDHTIRDVMKTMCELWQFNAVTFKDGFEAMAYLSEDTLPDPVPDVALIDIRMPGPWGHEISARIRDHDTLKNIGIILMTAYELPGSDEEAYLRTSRADELLFKPLPPMDELHAFIIRVIERRDEGI